MLNLCTGGARDEPHERSHGASGILAESSVTKRLGVNCFLMFKYRALWTELWRAFYKFGAALLRLRLSEVTVLVRGATYIKALLGRRSLVGLYILDNSLMYGGHRPWRAL